MKYYEIIDYKRCEDIQQFMINKRSSIAPSLGVQQKIKNQLAQILKRKKQQKEDLTKLNRKDEQEAEKLFDNISLSSVQQQNSDEQQNDDGSNKQAKGIEKESIKSILKSNEGQNNNKKSVKFAGQDKIYIVVDSNRKWNERLQNPRKGKFDPEQKRTLIQSLNKCLTQANLTFEQVVKTMSEDDQKIPRNLNFWTKVCSILTDRTLISSYKFLKRELSTKNKGGDWTEEETDLLMHLVEKVGRKWSLIAKQLNRTAENIRDKYRQIDEQKANEKDEKTIWKFEQLVKYLKYLQKYSGSEFLDEKINEQLEESNKHDQIELKQMKYRRYNSKTFNFHNNQVVRKYINRDFNEIKIENVNWQKISDKMKTKTIFDCRNKFVQILQLQIHGIGSKQFYEIQIVKFICAQKPKHEGDLKWQRWKHQQLSIDEAKNRWMILKRRVQGRGTKSFPELMQMIKVKFQIV